MKKIFLVFTFLFIFVLTSCEKSTSFSYEIFNHSSSTIYLDGINVITNMPISDSISMGSSKEVAVWSKFGKETNVLSPTSIFGTHLVITNIDGDTLQKDVLLSANWKSNIQEERAVAIHRYTFEINDIDFD